MHDQRMSVRYYMENQAGPKYYMRPDARKALDQYFQDRSYLLDTEGTIQAIGYIIRSALRDLGAVG